MLAERAIGADSARMGLTRAIPRPYQPTCAPPPPTLPQSSAVRKAEATQTHAHLAGHTGGAALVVAAFGSAALST